MALILRYDKHDTEGQKGKEAHCPFDDRLAPIALKWSSSKFREVRPGFSNNFLCTSKSILNFMPDAFRGGLFKLTFVYGSPIGFLSAMFSIHFQAVLAQDLLSRDP